MKEPATLESEVEAILATATRVHIQELCNEHPASAHLQAARDLIISLQKLPSMPSLVFRRFPGSPVEVVTVTDEPLTVGRSPACQVALPDAGRLSKSHFSIASSGLDTAPRLRHLSETNMTTINGNACESDRDYLLLDGDTIAAGRMLFLFLHATKVAS